MDKIILSEHNVVKRAPGQAPNGASRGGSRGQGLVFSNQVLARRLHGLPPADDDTLEVSPYMFSCLFREVLADINDAWGLGFEWEEVSDSEVPRRLFLPLAQDELPDHAKPEAEKAPLFKETLTFVKADPDVWTVWGL